MTKVSDHPKELKNTVTPDNPPHEQDEPSKKKKQKNKKRKRGNPPPQPGDEGYLTPTQLRNARKRRSKKTIPEQDPSSKFLGNPKSAPTCQIAKEFFTSLQQQPQHSTDFRIHVGPTKGWRTVAKLAVRGNGKDLSIGLFAPNSHRLIAVPDCTAHHPGINAAVAHMERCCRQVGVHAFDDTTGQGYLRFVTMNVQRTTGMIQLTLVWNSDPYSYASDDTTNTCEGKLQLDNLVKVLSPSNSKPRRRGTKQSNETTTNAINTKIELHSLWVHFNSSWKHSNAIFAIDVGPGHWKHIFGPPDIVEELSLLDQPNPVPLHFAPNVFRQANLDAFSKIVAAIRLRLSQVTHHSNQTAVELYGGVGTIGLNVADLVSTLTSSDENPFNQACFDTSATEAKLTNVTYESKNATDMVQSSKAFQNADILLVDPPRKGLEEPVLNALCAVNNQAKLLVYVSCGFDAFKRDCTALLDCGKWKLDHAEGHLLFPGSDAIETLAFFVRKQ